MNRAVKLYYNLRNFGADLLTACSSAKSGFTKDTKWKISNEKVQTEYGWVSLSDPKFEGGEYLNKSYNVI